MENHRSRMNVITTPRVALSLLVLLLLGVVALLQAQTPVPTDATSFPRDPGVRGGAAAAGGPIPGLTSAELAFFNASLATFREVDSVSGTVAGAAGVGLGPRFNMDSCAGCHAQPATGGTSPFTNPQVAVATRAGAINTVPFFITIDGPVREARFKRNPDGSPDGGVHALFTITGRSDAPGCTLAQPDFHTAAAHNNLIFRMPTPVFGAGLLEAIEDSTIVANKLANAATKDELGIAGHENREGNTGTVTRFGWKAQNKSLELFAGEAYNVEQGVTNEIFQNERDETPTCLFNGIPEDHTNFTATTLTDVLSDVVKFAIFTRFLNQPTPARATDSTRNGSQQFRQIGCALCHTPSLSTGASSSPALSNKVANLFSDMLVHKMGTGLADGISQGNAAGDEFRTAPLWGVGQRIFFLHDGRTRDLLQAIRAHASPGSEANAVIQNFADLDRSEQQDVLNFLRSL